jgi:putative flavoprotein involved in K+ transport
LTGIDGGHDADLRDLARRGATLLGSLGAVRDGRLRFVADLEHNLAKGDESFAQFTRMVDEHITRHRLSVPDAPTDRSPACGRWQAGATTAELDVQAAGITSVIWAVGYRHDFDWIRCAALDSDGRPLHRRGVSPTPGLYFLGLPRLHKVKSAFLWGVGEDAAYLAARIQEGRS